MTYLRCALAVAVIATFESVCFAQAIDGQLAPGETASSIIQSGEVHTYTLSVPPGASLVRVSQFGRDVALRLIETPILTINRPTLRDEDEILLLEADDHQSFKLEVFLADDSDATGEYDISIVLLSDELRIGAYRYETSAVRRLVNENEASWLLSVEEFEAALSIWQRTGEQRRQARALYSIAYVHYYFRGVWQPAWEAAAQAAALYDELGEPRLAINARQLQAATAIELSLESTGDDVSIGSVLELFTTVLREQERLSMTYDYAQTLNYLGYFHFMLGEFTQASSNFESAFDLLIAMQEYGAAQNSQANLEAINLERGSPALAVKNYRWLLANAASQEDSAWRADTLDNLASALLVTSDPIEALRNYQEALEIHLRNQSREGTGRSRTGIGYTYLSMGEFSTAIAEFDRAWDVRRELDDPRGQLSVLRGLGIAHNALSDFAKALEYQDIALAHAVSPLDIVKIQAQRARTLVNAGQFEAATKAIDVVRIELTEHATLSTLAETAFEAGRISARTGQSRDAAEMFENSLAEFERIGSLPGQAKSLLELAKLNQSINIERAIEFGEEAIDRLLAVRGRIADTELRATYLANRRSYYEFLIRAYMERSTSAQTKDEQQLYQLAALSLSEQSRARATLDLIAQTGSNTDTRLHPEQAAQRDALYEELIAAQYARDRLIDGVTGLEVLDQAANRLSDARSAIAVFESDLQAGLQQGMGISSSRILHAESMSAVIDDDAALLQYFLGEFGSFLWVVTQESIDVFELPPEAEISRLAKSLHDMLSMPARARTGSTDKTSSQLAATIIEPALPLIGNRRLILVAADAGLQYLPFSTLPIGDGDRVVDKFEVAVIPSLSLMEMHRTIHADRPRPQNTLVALGDPIFSANDPRLPDMIPADDRSASALPRLVFSGDEVESIAAMIPPGQATVRVAAAANRQFVLDGGLASYQYVHLATHGLVDSAQPALSRLVLSQFDARGNAVEGRLYLHEIYRLLLYSDVVVLSACDTAMGRDIRGEGLIGFTQAFLYAGSRSVIASLWPVRDRPTKELMTRFYANLLHKQLNPTEALRSAKRELSSDRRWSDPHYWAGFVFQGDWSTDKNN